MMGHGQLGLDVSCLSAFKMVICMVGFVSKANILSVVYLPCGVLDAICNFVVFWMQFYFQYSMLFTVCFL